MKVFLFDNGTNSVIVNEPEVLLIKEFAALWTNERNKTKEDPTEFANQELIESLFTYG